jgi:putative glycosyltransferase (TIGR04372 family)
LCGRHVPLAFIYTNNPKSLLITKHHIHKKSKKELTLSEIFSSNAAMSVSSEEFEQNGVELEETSPEEIRDLVIEMDERLNGNWNETEEDLLLQKKFWSIFIENMKRLNLKQPMHGKIRAKFSAKFLRDNQNWIR